MSQPLELAPDVAREVVDHAIASAPREACGILLGPEPDLAEQALRAENVHENPRTEYEIEPDTLLEAVQRAEKGDLDVVGFYHSHPRGPAAFSDTDRSRGSWEGKAYLLVSLRPLEVLAGRWDGEAFEDVPVRADVET